MHRATLIVEFLAIALLTAAQAQGETVRFPSDNGDLQALLDDLAPGDTVLIEPGQWAVWNIYLRDGITLMAENGDPSSTCLAGISTHITLCATDVSGVVLEDFTVKRGLRAISCGGSEVLLRGMVVTGSPTCLGCWRSSQVVLENVFLDADSEHAVECHQSELQVDGAEFSGSTRGVECWGSTVDIAGAVVRNNGRAQSGAGLWCSSSDVVLTDCVFESNEVGYVDYTHTSWVYGGEGGGVFLTNGSTMSASDVTFSSNHTWYAGGGLGLRGDGTRAELSGCTFIGNTTSTHVGSEGARQCGAAVSVLDGAEATLHDVWFIDNWSNLDGGAVCADDLSPGGQVSFSYCVFADNIAQSRGSALCLLDGPISMANCTAYAELFYGDQMVYWGSETTGAVSNCAFGRGGGVDCHWDSGVAFSHCCSIGRLCGQSAENLHADPLFCSPEARDFSLCEDSPCLPNNNEWGEPIGAFPVGCGPCGTVVRETSWGSIKAMYRGD